MARTAKTKIFTIYALGPDNRYPDKKMRHIDGPKIQDAIKRGTITPDDTWDCDELELIKSLREKGVIWQLYYVRLLITIQAEMTQALLVTINEANSCSMIVSNQNSCFDRVMTKSLLPFLRGEG